MTQKDAHAKAVSIRGGEMKTSWLATKHQDGTPTEWKATVGSFVVKIYREMFNGKARWFVSYEHVASHGGLCLPSDFEKKKGESLERLRSICSEAIEEIDEQ